MVGDAVGATTWTRGAVDAAVLVADAAAAPAFTMDVVVVGTLLPSRVVAPRHPSRLNVNSNDHNYLQPARPWTLTLSWLLHGFFTAG